MRRSWDSHQVVFYYYYIYIYIIIMYESQAMKHLEQSPARKIWSGPQKKLYWCPQEVDRKCDRIPKIRWPAWLKVCVRYWGIKRAKKQPISTKAQLKCLVRDSIPDEKLFVTLDIKAVLANCSHWSNQNWTRQHPVYTGVQNKIGFGLWFNQRKSTTALLERICWYTTIKERKKKGTT